CPHRQPPHRPDLPSTPNVQTRSKERRCRARAPRNRMGEAPDSTDDALVSAWRGAARADCCYHQLLHSPARTPKGGKKVNIEFLATVAVIAPDPLQSRRLYVDALG